MKKKYSPEAFMREAIKLSAESVRSGGGPFGAVIVRDGEIIARGENRVTVCNDPTAHAEVSAIREAAARLGTYDLSGCELYSSCEPCPMCLGAIYWARLDKLYYAGTRADAANVGFDDAHIYEELPLEPSQRELPTETLLREEAQRVFEAWAEKADKKEY